MHQDYGNKGFEIISISLDKETERAKYKQFVKDNKMDWLHIMDGKYWNADLAKRFEVKGIPAVFLVDPKGVCVADDESLNIHDSGEFSKKLKELMKKTPPTVKGGRLARSQKALDAANALFEKKDYDKALKAYEKIAAADKEGELGKKASARIKEMKADKEIMKTIASAEATKKAPSLLKMAASLAQAGKNDQARKYYQQVIDKYPETEYAETAKQEINKLNG